ncbi:hypothetical protein ACTVMR_00075 [Serratia nevei]
MNDFIQLGTMAFLLALQAVPDCPLNVNIPITPKEISKQIAPA